MSLQDADSHAHIAHTGGFKLSPPGTVAEHETLRLRRETHTGTRVDQGKGGHATTYCFPHNGADEGAIEQSNDECGCVN